MLHDELVRLDLSEEQQPERCVLIEVLLADADTASFERTTMARWWWGTEIERAWARLREVEERSTDLLPDNEVVVRAVAALANATPRLATGDPRRIKLAELIDQADRATDVNPALASQLRAATVAVLRASHANADFMHHQARGLRNRTLLGSVITVVVAGLVVLGQAHLATTSLLDQPDDWSNSSWQYMILVMLLGCVGALFTAIPAMSKVPTDSSPFNMPLQQAILKIVFGAVAAVVGLAIVNTDIVQSDLTNSMPGVVVLGVVFGAGQQIVTQFVDREAKQILGTT